MTKEARIEILKGNEAGAQFRVTGSKVRFGRSSESDIIVTDNSASRNHAELVKVNDSFIIRDMNSSNGIFVNGKKVKEHYLSSGDVFSIGDHEYRYIEKESAGPSASEQARARVSEGTIAGLSSSSMDVNVPTSSASGGGLLKNKRILVILAVIGVLFLVFILLPTNKAEPKKDNNNGQQTSAVGNDSSKMGDIPSDESEDEKFRRKIPDDERELFDQANGHYFEGQREMRLQNYSRALEEFRKAVAFYPQHLRARTAAGQTLKLIEDESRNNLSIGKKMYSQKRYEDALRHFNEVLNLNNRQPDSVLYKEAEKWKNMTEKRKGEVFE